MSGERREVLDVPDSQVNFIVAMMESDGAHVTKVRQDDGRWTVVGEFPDRTALTDGEPAVAPTVPSAETTGFRPDFIRDVDVLARTIWGEARGESRLGMEAVAAVVVNRLRKNKPGRFGASIIEVCLKPAQFSCWNAADPNLDKIRQVTEADALFALSLEIARIAVSGALRDPTDGSDHYHSVQSTPDWARGKQFARRIDNHLFYNDIG